MSKQHSRWLAFKMWAGWAARGRTASKPNQESLPEGGRLFKQSAGGSLGASGDVK